LNIAIHVNLANDKFSMSIESFLKYCKRLKPKKTFGSLECKYIVSPVFPLIYKRGFEFCVDFTVLWNKLSGEVGLPTV